VSLRTRLAVVAAGAVAAAVALASLAVYFIVRHELYGPVNRGLEQAVQQIHLPRLAALETGSHPHEFVFSRFGFGPSGGFPVPYRVLTSDGRYVVPNDQSPLASLPVTSRERAVASGDADSFFFDTTIDRQSARVYTQQLAPGYAVQVAGSIVPQNHALSKIRFWLILVAIAGVALASAAGFFIARGALRPVRRLSETAEHVRQTRDLTRRIDVTGHDEVGQLATTFNAMLESLDAAAQRQRQLVQDASHELRTPLTSLRTNIELLASGKRLPVDERQQLLDDVVAQLGEMTALIGELTELARGEEHAQPLEEVRLDLVAEEAIKRTARNHPDVPIDADLAQTTVVGTPATLERAIANLLDNAAKWSPRGARVEVQLWDSELTVRDHGPGIDDADLPHVFERFYRATSARSLPGSGLGLAIVKQVAEAHGGTVTAERAADGGTIMRFKISRNGGSATQTNGAGTLAKS
jgi:two-component system sensor histidine kinase MprB